MVKVTNKYHVPHDQHTCVHNPNRRIMTQIWKKPKNNYYYYNYYIHKRIMDSFIYLIDLRQIHQIHQIHHHLRLLRLLLRLFRLFHLVHRDCQCRRWMSCIVDLSLGLRLGLR